MWHEALCHKYDRSQFCTSLSQLIFGGHKRGEFFYEEIWRMSSDDNRLVDEEPLEVEEAH